MIRHFRMSLGKGLRNKINVKRENLIMDKKNLLEIVGNVEKEDLIEIICFLVNKNPKLERNLLEYCQKNSIFENKTFITEQQLLQGWENSKKLIDELDETVFYYEYEISPTEDNLFSQLEEIMKIVNQNEISWETREKILLEVLNYIFSEHSEYYDCCNLEEWFMNLVKTLCQTKEEKRYLVDCIIESGVSGYLEWIMSIYREIGEDEKYLEIRKANLNTTEQYWELSQYYEEKNKKNLALETALTGLEKGIGGIEEIFGYLFKFYSKEHNDKILEELYDKSMKKNRNYAKFEITELMYSYYKKNNNYEKMKNLMLLLVKLAPYDDLLDWYKECQKELSEEDFKLYEEQIINIIKNKDASAYLKICLVKNNKKEVLDYLQKNPYIDRKHYFSEKIASEYPKEILELYWKEAQDFANLGQRHNYDYCVSVLSSIKKIMDNNNWKDEWKIKFETFFEKNKKKRLLVERMKARFK